MEQLRNIKVKILSKEVSASQYFLDKDFWEYDLYLQEVASGEFIVLKSSIGKFVNEKEK